MNRGPADWKISEIPGGWAIEVRYHVPLADLLPGYIQRNVPYALMMLGVNLALVGVFAWFVVGQTWQGLLLASPAVVAIGLAVSIVLWPLRFGDWGPPSPEHLLRYRLANRVEHATVAQGHLDAHGVFDLDCLRTLRIQRVNRFDGFVNLVFDGNVVHDVQLVGWPGLPEDVAADLCETLLRKVAGGASL